MTMAIWNTWKYLGWTFWTFWPDFGLTRNVDNLWMPTWSFQIFGDEVQDSEGKWETRKVVTLGKKKHNSPNLLLPCLSNNHHNLCCHHPCHHDCHQEELQVLPSFVAQQMIRDIAMEEEKTHGTVSQNSTRWISFSKKIKQTNPVA